MESNQVLVTLITVAIILSVVTRLIAGSMDTKRIEKYIQEMGGQLLEKHWKLFGPGWFGTQYSRIYEVVYRDREKNLYRAYVKTSMFSGVYLSENQLISHPTRLSVEEEKARLRKRLEELEKMSTTKKS